MIRPAMGSALFVTGTDTGVGKTVVTAALALATGAGVMKPIGCGVAQGEEEHADTRFLREASGSGDRPEEVTPLCFRAFRAPLVAARLEGRVVDLAPVWTVLERMRARHTLLLVEGVGGVRVPIAPGYEVLDFLRDAKMPALIVARSGLGTMNHTALTAEALSRRGIPVIGFVLNDGAAPCEDSLAQENAAVASAMTGLSCLGRLRPDPLVQAGRRALSPATVGAVSAAAMAWARRAA